MQDELDAIVKAIEDAGGRAEWQAVVDAVPATSRQRVIEYMRVLEKEGKARRVSAYDAETKQVSFYVTTEPKAETEANDG